MIPAPTSNGKCCPKYTREYPTNDATIIARSIIHVLGIISAISNTKVKAVAV
jgi:hypothetical protein